MAGIEQLEIHSKSYIVRWVKVDEGHTISWSVQPHKKSINFGIVKHPGSGAANLSSSAHADGVNTSIENLDTPTSENPKGGARPAAKKDAAKDVGVAQELLASKGFVSVKWHGKCEADKVSMGTFDVAKGQGGMFGLVFDNTFSKQTGKTATFVLLTYPTGQPPQATYHLPNLQAGHSATKSATSLAKGSPRLGPAANESLDSLHSHMAKGTAATTPRSDSGGMSPTYHVGNLLKRRRKKGQGFARRFFSLDYSSCTLSYYYNRNSSALRGAIPLSLAAIAADERRREISIDSGAEVWHLRASNAKEFEEWARALERASRIARGMEPEPAPEGSSLAHEPSKLTVPREMTQFRNTQQEEDREWQQVESMVSRVVGTRDALRRLVKDMAAQKHHSSRPPSAYLSPGTPGVPEEGSSDGYFAQPVPEKRPFWRRKSSAATPTPSTLQSSVSSTLAVPSPNSATTLAASGPTPKSAKRKSKGAEQEEKSYHDHCTALLNDLDSVVAEFTNVIAQSKRRRAAPPGSAAGSRRSLESSVSIDEFFDAEAGDMDSHAQVVMIDRRSGEDGSHSDDDDDDDQEDASIHSSSSVSTAEDEQPTDVKGLAAQFPVKPKSLSPLPIDIAVERRTTIPAATVLPPSLIAFVRKNVGKDLSTISMPVSANEPTSLLQRVAEQLEYAQLLDAASKSRSPQERLACVTAFAVSQFSINRTKERAIRKPFNPLLGETFEMLRTESEVPGGFRLVVEKVTHRPVRLAMQADAAHWSIAQSPAPSQKFWGKSAELTTDGRVRLALRLAAQDGGAEELYSWNTATMFLRNVVMGEKYIEPVGTMTVVNDSSGARAQVEFRSKGMFGGRGEEVAVEMYGADGSPSGAGLTGTWTGSLRMAEGGRDTGREVWRAGELVANAPSVYGMTTFAASLNEITAIERGRLPVTDSRLRPDQRACEEGRLDEAEADKVRLEEAQRERRRRHEDGGEEWRPRWFVKMEHGSDGEEMWRLKSGREGYWESRERGFQGAEVVNIFG